MSTIEYGSGFTGELSKNTTTIGHGIGIYEHGVQNNVVNQGGDLNDLVFVSGIPMKKYK